MLSESRPKSQQQKRDGILWHSEKKDTNEHTLFLQKKMIKISRKE
jgi:hypothetical protein